MLFPVRGLLPLLLSCVALAACNMPAVAPKPPAFQDSAVTVRDWDGVAQQIADGMSRRGLLPNPLGPQPAPPEYPYYISVNAADSRFLHEVHEALQSEILHRGGSVTVSPVGAMVINLDVDIVHWNGAHRYPGGLATLAGLATGTGLLLAENGPLSPAAQFGVAAGTGLALDLVAAATPHTNVEAVWQASALMGDKLVFDIRRPIYIDRNDIPLHGSFTRLGAMSSPGVPPAATPVRLRYDP